MLPATCEIVIRDLVAICRDQADEAIMKEVLGRRCYRRKSANFDVEAGEHWLDLGANIGAFALYCRERGATVDCYEPMPDNFALLQQNAPEANCFMAAVTAEKSGTIAIHQSKSSLSHARATILDTVHGYKAYGVVANVYAGDLMAQYFDGIKADIEGAELALLDARLIPPCKKFVFEYHSSRDGNLDHLRERLRWLELRFDHVTYSRELKRVMAGEKIKPYYDRLVWAWMSS